MPKEIITIQVGQCGNQIGRAFWEHALQEHATYNTEGFFDEGMSSLFRNVDSRYEDPVDLPMYLPMMNSEVNWDPHSTVNNSFRDNTVSNSLCRIHRKGYRFNSIKSLRARAVLVDMDAGPVNETNRSDLGDLFDSFQQVTDVSGAGNNFAHGHHYYGNQYKSSLYNVIRRASEKCNSLQSFFLFHSLGGGTGSGLGTYILSLLHDEFPEIQRLTTSIYPSNDDDVITSPYNALLSQNQLIEHADVVLPIENQALIDMISSAESEKTRRISLNGQNIAGDNNSHNNDNATEAINNRLSKSKGYEKMNSIVGNYLCNLTASVRFNGDLNVDINEIGTNMVPYPDLKFLLSSMATTHYPPLTSASTKFPSPSSTQLTSKNKYTSIRQLCSNIMNVNNQMVCDTDPYNGTTLACSLLFRTPCDKHISITDVTANVYRLQKQMNMINWNQEGFKLGYCNVPGVFKFKERKSTTTSLQYIDKYATTNATSVLCLSNNCSISKVFQKMDTRFTKLYSRKAMLHHYLEYMEDEDIKEAKEAMSNLIHRYNSLDRTGKIGENLFNKDIKHPSAAIGHEYSLKSGDDSVLRPWQPLF